MGGWRGERGGGGGFSIAIDAGAGTNAEGKKFPQGTYDGLLKGPTLLANRGTGSCNLYRWLAAVVPHSRATHSVARRSCFVMIGVLSANLHAHFAAKLLLYRQLHKFLSMTRISNDDPELIFTQWGFSRTLQQVGTAARIPAVDTTRTHTVSIFDK